MMLVDANILVYAYYKESERHEAARTWLEGQLVGAARVGLPWPSLLAFVRLVTNPRLFTEPASITTAWAQVESWLSAKSAWIPTPGEHHQTILGKLLAVPGLRANDVPDAHLAALAVEHGLTLATSDFGFARFPDLSWTDPISSS